MFSVSVLYQGAEIEVDENGTLDLSMKKNRILDKSIPPTSSHTIITTPSSSPFKASSLLVNAAFYQALCDQEGWDVPINYSKTHGKTEEEKEVLCQCVCQLDFLSNFSFTFLSPQASVMPCFRFSILFLCLWMICLRLFMYSTCMSGAYEGHKGGSYPKEQELYVMVSHLVCAVSWTPVPQSFSRAARAI